jgi:hypothetical protein
MYKNLLSISEPWLQYAIRINLLGDRREDLHDLKQEVLRDEKIQTLLNDITNFHNKIVRNHKDPDLSIHKLIFLLDIGLETDIPQIKIAIDQILKHKDKNGVYQSLTNIPQHYGGIGEDVFGWCLCDAPLLLLALQKAKIDYEQNIKQGVKHLLSLFKEQGFPCSVSEEHGTFRGPGRKGDCCPNATFTMLKLLSEIDEYRNSDVVKSGTEYILSLWENSLERHPYMFYMGTDFRKLKAPSIWYDIVSVAGLLSKFDFVINDPRFCEMIDLIKGKQDADGMFVPESVYQKFKGWDFGQKKTASPYLSFLCITLLKRLHP